MKDQILEKLIKERLGFDLFIRLVFTRMIKVMAVCLILTLIAWLLWLENYVWGSFLAGAVLGLLVFLILNFLKRHLGYQKAKESPGATNEAGNLTDPEEIRPKASVED
ncbi:MAG: hypothetical protein KAX39_08315 [candidate division Zixibacteria bacterium]|nr:hypothetical protein [candidate division Zixibacteria bacterium]